VTQAVTDSHLSLRRYLLVGILLPVALFMFVDTVTLYRQALSAVNTAYDRTLLASAKSIGELLDVEGEGKDAILHATVPYAALEAFEADNRSRMVYRISNVKGELVGGEDDLPAWNGKLPDQGPYAALVDFYDGEFRGDAVRVAVLLQPVASQRGRGMATIQVANPGTASHAGAPDPDRHVVATNHSGQRDRADRRRRRAACHTPGA